MKQNRHSKNDSIFGILIGFLLIGGGLVYLLYNFGFIEWPVVRLIISFPSILLIFSLYWLFFRNFFTGFMLLLVSLILLVPKVSIYYPDLINFPFQNLSFKYTIVPILFILFGISIISKILARPKKKDSEQEYEFIDRMKNSGFFQKLFSGKNVIFGASKNIVIAPIFKGTDINTVFGGAVLDLRKTDIEEGETTIEVNVVFGGVEIYVPSNWEVITNTTNILGATEDKRFYTDEKAFSNKKLIIKGSCVFGGIEIKN
ncbi:MAG: LiaF domain-containing protein [Bacteroidales bacterium]